MTITKNKKKMYFLYSEDGKEYIDTCLGVEELALFLNKKVDTVKANLRSLKNKKIKYINIKGANRIKRTKLLLVTEDDFNRRVVK